MDEDTATADRKALTRAHYLRVRAARSEAERARAEAALLQRAQTCDAAVVAGFVPVNGEPGSLAVLDELARRATVLLPIIRSRAEPLQWAAYGGRRSLVPGPLGLLQPPRTDGSRLSDADVVLVPAVAIGRDGSRLGHGGGFYDRALAGLPPERLYGVVHDDEVAPSLPTEPHDVRVGWLLTPTTLQRLTA